MATVAGDPLAVRAAAEEGCDLAEAIGDRFGSRLCRSCLGFAQIFQGDLARRVRTLRPVVAEARAAHDEFLRCLASRIRALRWLRGRCGCGAGCRRGGRRDRAPSLADLERASRYWALAFAALAAGDAADGAGRDRGGLARRECPAVAGAGWGASEIAEAALAGGDLVAAAAGPTSAVSTMTGSVLVGRADGACPRGDRPR